MLDLTAKAHFTAQPGDILLIETPGGGGWGR
jgi:N-methylhydantoinase B/oxoprolinase/acetone carboxylase alpha subunit